MASTTESCEQVSKHFYVTEHSAFNGRAKAGATVVRRVHLDLSGVVIGDLTIEEGASAEVRGRVIGDIINRGVISIYGTVEGSVRDEPSGWSYIARSARVRRLEA